MQKKSKLFATKLRKPSEQNINIFKTYNNIYNKIRRIAKIKYYEAQFIQQNKNIKQTWGLIREVIGSKKDKRILYQNILLKIIAF